MPLWHLKDAWKEIQEEYNSLNPDGEPLPLGADKVGGCSVDLMVGIRYHRYFPALLYTLPGGLGIYKSKFSCPGGRSGLLGGPHKAWKSATEFAATMGPRSYLTAEARAYFIQGIVLHHQYQGPVAEETVEGPDADSLQ